MPGVPITFYFWKFSPEASDYQFAARFQRELKDANVKFLEYGGRRLDVETIRAKAGWDALQAER